MTLPTKYLEATLLATIALFAPVKAALITTIVLIFVDLIAGLLAARKSGQAITSSGIKRTVGKVVLYELAICIGHLVQTYLTGDVLPASKMVTALIGMVELKSILENLDTINGTPVFKALVERVVQSQSDIGKK